MAFDTQRFNSGLHEQPLPSTVQGSAVSNATLVLPGDYGRARSIAAQLNVTAVGGTPSLTVFIDDSVDGGATWQQQIAFTAATAVGVNRQTLNTPFGNLLRIRWSLTGTTPSATFQVDWVVKQ